MLIKYMFILLSIICQVTYYLYICKINKNMNLFRTSGRRKSIVT